MDRELTQNEIKQRAIMCRGYTRREFLGAAGATAAAGGLTMAAPGMLGLPDLGFQPQSAQGAAGQSLVLFDGSASGNSQFGWIGQVHAMMLANLLGRFLPAGASANNTVRKPISQYNAGDVNNFDATFYLGHTFDNPLPAAFMDDVMSAARTKPVMMFKYNIWRLYFANPTVFKERFGFGPDHADDTWLEGPTTFGKVLFKGQTFTKSLLDSEIVATKVTDPARASAFAEMQENSGRRLPYIVKGDNNFWYVSDLPFAYMSEEDRYGVFADSLFEVMGRAHTPSKRALVRLEDVSAISDPDQLRATADYLKSKNVPFSVATIPIYKDPTGYYNGGQPETISINKATAVKNALKYMRNKGGEIVMHGTTHQFGNSPNPYNAVSADDFEFFRVTENADHSLTFHGPVSGDSSSWVRDRLNEGIRELNRAKLPFIGFEAPHYAMSKLDYVEMAKMFQLAYHRVLYFEDRTISTARASAAFPARTQERIQERKRRKARRLGRRMPIIRRADVQVEPDKFGGQFFPYVCTRDVYGSRLLPENLNNIEPERWPDPVAGPFPRRLPSDLVRDASRNRVLRDAWASFYFHPFFDLAYLRETVEGIQGAGFTFVKASSVTT